MKKIIYIILFTALGILLSFLVHALTESIIIALLTRNFDRYSLGLSWQQWFIVHYYGSIILFVLGVIFGFLQGRLWWRIIYVEKKFSKHDKLIILDFDHTVFNTTKYVQALKEKFSKNFGIDADTFMQQRNAVKKCCVVIDIDEFVDRLPHADKKALHKTLIDTTRKLGRQFLFPDVISFMERHKKNYDILVITHGDQELQSEKIQSVKLPSWVEHRISLQPKDQVVGSYLKKYKQVHFVDDKNKNIDLVKTAFPDIITYFIKRPVDHPYGHIQSVCDCADHVVADLNFSIEA